jgi:predicted ATPase
MDANQRLFFDGMSAGVQSRQQLISFADEVRGIRPTPELLTTLVGRLGDLRKVADALVTEPKQRLLTLTGPGGVGKTRLALEVARQSASSFPGGVRFVPLGHQRDPALVPKLLGKAFGLCAEDEERVLARLAAAEPGTALVVLDNFEHLLRAVPFVSRLLADVPQLAVLATSREPLHLSAEREYRVPPLPAEDAVALFVERARAVSEDFELSESNEAAVAAVCARLEGLPLAIELAAARVRLLSPHAILERLERPLELLVGGPRDLPARQRTLRDTIAWSHSLLTPYEQRLFARLAAFAGCSRLEAAESLAALGNDDSSGDVLDGLVALVDRNLLRRVHYSNGEVRLAMLDTVREFALERLGESGEEHEIRSAHACLYADLVERASARYDSAEEERWLDLLEIDHKNLRAALRWSLDVGDARMACRLAEGLEPFWRARGHATEGAHWLAEARAAAGIVHNDPSGLTVREVEILRLVAAGLSNARIAERLVVSVRTVHAHVRSIYRKLGVSSRAEATRYALVRRLV